MPLRIISRRRTVHFWRFVIYHRNVLRSAKSAWNILGNLVIFLLAYGFFAGFPSFGSLLLSRRLKYITNYCVYDSILEVVDCLINYFYSLQLLSFDGSSLNTILLYGSTSKSMILDTMVSIVISSSAFCLKYSRTSSFSRH